MCEIAMGQKVIAYIDGFNFYNGVLKDRFPSLKWLDLVQFCKILMAGNDVIKVKYFTALVKEFGDPNRPVRQQVYWRALTTLYPEKIEIIKGHFRVDPKFLRIAKYQHMPCSNHDRRRNEETRNSICVMRPEEKGSDVNIAVHLLNDAWTEKYDKALLISNDTDLTEAVRLVETCCNKRVILANPFSWTLSGTAIRLTNLNLELRHIKKEQLIQSQLPSPIPGTTIHKPEKWNR